MDYFRSFLGLSKVVTMVRVSSDHAKILKVCPSTSQQRMKNNQMSEHLEFRDTSSMFVFGGDCFDKGRGDIRISRMLVDLKRRHPHRVRLILGVFTVVSECVAVCVRVYVCVRWRLL